MGGDVGEQASPPAGAVPLLLGADALVRGVWKEFGISYKNYAKGQGYKNYLPWLVANHAGEMYLLPPRGDCGSRHDFSTEAAMYLYHDRPFYLEFLQSRMYGDDNILEVRFREREARARAHASSGW